MKTWLDKIFADVEKSIASRPKWMKRIDAQRQNPGCTICEGCLKPIDGNECRFVERENGGHFHVSCRPASKQTN